MKIAVLYGALVDTDDDGVFLDYPYIGGVVDNQQEAELLAKSINNDKSINCITKHILFFEYRFSIGEVKVGIAKRFSRMAINMYDYEDIQTRHELSRKKK